MGTNGSDRASTLDAIEKATAHLLDTAQSLTEDEVAGPSLLPGWTRGHVLTHVARNADALVNLLTWARTGEETPMYASREARDAEIEAGAGRSAGELAADVQASAARFSDAARAMPEDAWSAEVRRRVGPPMQASRVLWLRLEEVVIHHVDLDGGYSPAHWPADFVAQALAEVTRHFATRDDFPPLALHAEDTDRRFVIHPEGGGPIVSGPEPALLAWLIGRSTGDGLGVEPHGELPAVPKWG